MQKATGVLTGRSFCAPGGCVTGNGHTPSKNKKTATGFPVAAALQNKDRKRGPFSLNLSEFFSRHQVLSQGAHVGVVVRKLVLFLYLDQAAVNQLFQVLGNRCL